MNHFLLDHKRAFLLTLPLTLAACSDDTVNPSTGTETETGTGTSSSTTEPGTTTTTTTTDPTTSSTTDPTTSSTTDSTTTTGPDTTTTDPGTTTTATDTSTGTTDTSTSTTDTSTGSSTGTGTGTGGDTDTGGDVFELASVWVAANPAGLASDALVGFDPALAAQQGKVVPTGDVASIQSIAVTGGGDGLITVDMVGGGGGVIIDEDMVNMPPAMGTIGVGQRFIRGPKSELQTPKGVEADVPGGIFLVADTAAKDIKAFDNDDDGDLPPLFKITNIGASPAIWDMHYESSSDTLYAAGTDGVVRIYDGFSINKGANGPNRSVTPFLNNNKVSVNLHGVAVVANTLFLSDVGDANNTTDGQVFVLNNAASLNGNIAVTQRIQGGKLGNPVDLEVIQSFTVGDSILVAEKSNDAFLIYNKPLMAPSFTLVADVNRAKLESVARITNNLVILSSNPAGVETDQAFVQVPNIMGPPPPSSTLNQVGSATSIESLVFTAEGHGLVSFDGPAQSGGGGVFTVNGLADVKMDTTASIAADRLWGPDTAVVAPKGVVLSDAGDTLFVADFGAVAVKVFGAPASGDIAPKFVLNDLGSAPWDVAYDDASDRLYVACVDGVVRVYDDVLLNQGGTFVRAITPANDQSVKISVNLHGIEYDPVGDLLLLSDVGSAMVNTDGQLFLVGSASTADGPVPVLAQVGGDQTKLGNPVDIAYDGANLYVAEKANSLVLRYDGFTALAGTNNLAASAETAVASAESVALAFKLVP